MKKLLQENVEMHPSKLFIDILKRNGVSKAELSIYKYRPQTVKDERRITEVSLSRLNYWLSNTQNHLNPGEEIAFHSRVVLDNGQICHIPMIDFVCSDANPILMASVDLIKDMGWSKAFLIESGRSFHLYCDALITTPDWYKFMGRILLMNLPGEPQLVDTRWVGHRLMAGYSALRWTWNSPHYLSKPKFRSYVTPEIYETQKLPRLVPGAF